MLPWVVVSVFSGRTSKIKKILKFKPYFTGKKAIPFVVFGLLKINSYSAIGNKTIYTRRQYNWLVWRPT